MVPLYCSGHLLTLWQKSVGSWSSPHSSAVLGKHYQDLRCVVPSMPGISAEGGPLKPWEHLPGFPKFQRWAPGTLQGAFLEAENVSIPHFQRLPHADCQGITFPQLPLFPEMPHGDPGGVYLGMGKARTLCGAGAGTDNQLIQLPRLAAPDLGQHQSIKITVLWSWS